MNCILYARVSTDKQAQKELSIPAQLTAMRQFAKSSGWQVIAEYVDQGESARTMKRPELQKLIRFCADKKGVDIVIVHKLDRMARNLPDYLAIKAELKRKSIRLVSMTENFEDSVTGRLLENIIASISEWYSGNLGEEIKKTALTKLQRGEWPHQPPFGYQSVRTEDKRVAHVEDPASAALVRQAFELFATGDWSLGQISKVMAERGLQTSHGKNLSQEKIKHLLSNPFYMGILRWNGKEYKGKQIPIINADLFFRVQRVLKHRTIDREKGVRTFLLRGVVRCRSCGQRLTAEDHPRGSYYRCPSHVYATRCEEPYIPVSYLDEKLKTLYRQLESPQGTMELLREEIASIAGDRERRAGAELEALKQKVADIETKELALADDFVGKTISKEMYDRLSMKYQNERREAAARISQLSVDYKDPLEFFGKAAMTSTVLGTLHDKFRFRQRRTLLRAVFKSITVENRQIVSVELNPPFSTFIGNDRENRGRTPFIQPPIAPTTVRATHNMAP